MTKGTFIGISRASAAGFQFSVNVPEKNTHRKRLDTKENILEDFNDSLDPSLGNRGARNYRVEFDLTRD